MKPPLFRSWSLDRYERVLERASQRILPEEAARWNHFIRRWRDYQDPDTGILTFSGPDADEKRQEMNSDLDNLIASSSPDFLATSYWVKGVLRMAGRS